MGLGFGLRRAVGLGWWVSPVCLGFGSTNWVTGGFRRVSPTATGDLGLEIGRISQPGCLSSDARHPSMVGWWLVVSGIPAH